MKTRLVYAFSCIQISRLLTLVALAAPILALAQTVPAKPVADTVKLSVFTVTSEKNTGYQSLQTTSGMRTVQELKNVANSISIVNSELIADIGATSLMEVSKYFVSGEASPNPNGFQQTISRGIPSNSGALRNGWYWYSPQDSYAMERIELLRGPNAFLYGESAMGGMTNQVTKRGLFTRDFTRVKVTGGGGGLFPGGDVKDYNLRRAELDINRILLDNKLAFRLASVASNGNGWVDNAGRGSIDADVSLGSPQPQKNGTVLVDYSTKVAGSGRFLLNGETLSELANLPPAPSVLPHTLSEVQSSRPGLFVQLQTQRAAECTWVLRWETQGRNRDKQQVITPPPSELRLYQFPDRSDSPLLPP